MTRRPPISTRTYTLLPYATLFRPPSPPVRRVDRRECDQCAAGGVESGPQPEDQSMAIPARAAPRSRPPGVRDPRLDFFRGVAMLIIFVAHVPDNPWAGFIPARVAWSDATEMFVFCSGFAAAIAFGRRFPPALFGFVPLRPAP